MNRAVITTIFTIDKKAINGEVTRHDYEEYGQ
jgi:hypothetical protein